LNPGHYAPGYLGFCVTTIYRNVAYHVTAVHDCDMRTDRQTDIYRVTNCIVVTWPKAAGHSAVITIIIIIIIQIPFV